MKKIITSVKPPYLLVLAGVSCLVCITSLRSNNLQMVQLREQVYQVDRENGDVRTALTDLQHYVNRHMNTDLTPGRNPVYPPIQLKYTYERLLAANNQNLSNEQVYSDAQAHCEKLNSTDFSGRNRVPCISEYVSTHGANAPKTIPDSLYKYDFVSPSWSPDVAGWSLLTTVVLLILSAIAFVARRHVRRAHHG